jgi:Uma2 family endonuclease
MSAAFTPEKLRIDVDRYQKMVATGVLTKCDRVELIEGEIVDMAPIGARHSAVTARMNGLLVTTVGDAAIVSPGGPINLGQFSEPQPDLTLLKPRADFYGAKIPDAADVLLVIEVSDATLAYDQGAKLELYARYSIPEYWVVDVAAKKVIMYNEPVQHSYRKRVEIATGAISPLALPNVKVALDILFDF